MKVLLVSANTEQFNMPAMPLGLACVAAAVEQAGHQVSLLDLMFAMNARSVLQEYISEVKPECIGISVRNIDDQNRAAPRFLLDKVKEVVEVCRQLSEAPIVLGGAGYSMFPESALGYLDADMGIVGEGEVAFVELLNRLQNQTDPAGVPGLYIKEHTSVVRSARINQLDLLPLPSSNILSTSIARNKDPWIPVQTRRGCGLKCSYCSSPIIEGCILRRRSPQRVVDWVETWTKVGLSHFFFVDNTFNLPSNYAKDLCRKIIEKNLDVHWRAIIYPKHVDEELVRLMAAAGCRQISLGFESGSPLILKNLNKRFSAADVFEISGIFADHGIERMGFLLLGGPGETVDSVEESLAFADSLNLNSLRLTEGIRIYPGTRLAQLAASRGIIQSSDNLLRPQFFLEDHLKSWLTGRLQEWRKSRPYVIM